MSSKMEFYLEWLTKTKPDVRAIVSDILLRIKIHKPNILERLFGFRKIKLECWQHRECITTYVYRTLDDKPIPFDIVHEYGTPATITIDEIDRVFEEIEDIKFQWSDTYCGFNEFKCGFNEFKCAFYITFKP